MTYRACGSWPAFWTSNLANWVNGGEIDIYEGVNNEQNNHYAFHTLDGCVQTGQSQSGWISTTNCYNWADGQPGQGCGGWGYDSTTYGIGMNNVNDGVYALDWRKEGIRIWFFKRGSIPQDILNGNPTTAGWGTVSPENISLILAASRFAQHRM